MGIALQSWERYGWRGGWRQVYWLWRDRKGLAGNLITVLSNLVFLWGAFTWIASRMTGAEWFVPAGVPGWLEPFLGAALLLPMIHMGVRAVCVGRFFGWTFALGVPLRTIWANWLNCAATICALCRYTAARIRNRPLAWMKTEHVYPDGSALRTGWRRLGEILVESGSLTEDQLRFALRSLPEGVRLGEYLGVLGWVTEWELYEALSQQENVPLGHVEAAEVQREACRSLPLRFAREWKVFPFKIMAGSLFLAAAEAPGEELRRELARFTRLELRFQLVTPGNFATLVRHAL
jgi:adsorption protein B